MKKTLLSLLMVAASSVYAQNAADFSGYYVGAQFGSNQSKTTANGGASNTSMYPGFVLGYTAAQQDLRFGVEAFADYHNDSSTYKDVGFGLKVGKVFSNVLIYGRLGTTGTWPSWRPQFGAGAEFKVDKNVTFNTFFSRDRTTDAGITRENSSIAFGLNYYFN